MTELPTIRTVDPHSKQYDRDYLNGWNADLRQLASTSYQVESALERADARGVSHAWYDGYHDSAASREKWTYRTARRLGYDCAETYLTDLIALADGYGTHIEDGQLRNRVREAVAAANCPAGVTLQRLNDDGTWTDVEK